MHELPFSPSAPDATSVAGLLASHPVFRRVPAPVLHELTRVATVFELAPGEALYRAGGRAEHLFILLEGALHIELPEPPNTRGLVSAMLAAPAILGECQLLHERPWSGTGVALFRVTALGLTLEQLDRLLATQPMLARALYGELAHRFLCAIESWKRQFRAGPELVLARYLTGLCAVADRVGSSPCAGIRLRQTDLALWTRLRRETINRLLRSWARQGMVDLSEGQLTRIDARRLAALLPEGHPSLLVQGPEQPM